LDATQKFSLDTLLIYEIAAESIRDWDQKRWHGLAVFMI
jgi:hypothetical protein